MGFGARILAFSAHPEPEVPPLCTFEITFPRIVLAEFNTHRMFSRNSASSRAIPVEKMIRAVLEDPYIPTSWGKNQKGMQAEVEVNPYDQARARDAWLHARDAAVAQAQRLLDLGIHKQLTNRLLEPFLWHTVIVTATEWSNFFHLRNNPQAHPDIQAIAGMMQELYEELEPKALPAGHWHWPLVTDDELFHSSRVLADHATGKSRDELQLSIDEQVQRLCKVSVGRCARVSYLTHDGKRDLQADIDLHDKLLASGHLSPFEHVARPARDDDSMDQRFALHEDINWQGAWCGDSKPDVRFMWFGNFRGWFQYRKEIPWERDILAPRSE